MRHKIAGNRLSRNQTLRYATVRDLAKATLTRQRICTTKAKAKEARKLVEKLITLGKKGTLASKRKAFSILCDHSLVSDLFDKTTPRFKNRVGGYTRIINLGNRRGDNAQLVYLELTEKSEVIVSKPKTKASKKAQIADTKESSVDAKAQAATATLEKPQAESSAEAVQEDLKVKAPKKKDNIKDSKASKVTKDSAKQGKGIVGNIKKIFNRKTSA